MKRVIVLNDQGGGVMSVSENKTGTLRAEEHGHQPVICIQGNAIDRADTAGCNGKGWTEDKCFTLNTIDRPAVFDSQVYHGCKEFSDGICQTVNAQYGTGGNNQPLVVASMQGFGDYIESDTASSCKQRDYKDATDLVYSLDRASFNQGVNAKFDFQIEEDKASSLIARGPSAVYAAVDVRNGNENSDVNGTLQAKSNGGWNANSQNIVREHNHVRRLTPLECTRLQGYPDDWLDIPGASDSAKFKALGNSICLPFWEHLAYRFAQYGNVRTIGSLFDGIAGFPLVFKRAGCETAWVSEIEPFCQRVVAYHTERGDL